MSDDTQPPGDGATPKASRPARKRAGRKTSGDQRAQATAPRKSGRTRARADEAGTSPAPAADDGRERPDARPPAEPPRPVLTRMPIEARWRDLDAFNHVNNSNFLTYLEEARVRWLTGLAGNDLHGDILPLMVSVRLNYRRPIEWPAALAVELSADRLGTTSLTIGHRIVAADDDTVLYADGDVTMVWVDIRNGRPAPLPDAIRDACGMRPGTAASPHPRDA